MNQIANLPFVNLIPLAEIQEKRPTLLVTSAPAWKAVQDRLHGLKPFLTIEVIQATTAHWDSLLPTPTVTREGVYGASYLAQAADMAVALAKGDKALAAPVAVSNDMRRTLSGLARAMAPTQRYVRGIFSGGTFCFEAQLVHAAGGLRAHSNTPTAGNGKLQDNWKSHENTIVDMGDDEFTQGRPHPMIDPSLRDARIRDEVADPSTAVVLFDVVLGYGASDDPTAGLLGVIGAAKAKATAAGRTVAFIGYVCGTDLAAVHPQLAAKTEGGATTHPARGPVCRTGIDGKASGAGRRHEAAGVTLGVAEAAK